MPNQLAETHRQLRSSRILSLTCSQELYRQFESMLKQQQSDWDRKSHPRYPQAIYEETKIIRHFYAVKLLEGLLKHDGFINLDRFRAEVKALLGSEHDESVMYAISASLIRDIQRAGGQITFD